MAAMAAKVASDATIAALTHQASELDAKSQGQAEALKGLKAELKAQRKALSEAGGKATESEARIAKLEEDLAFTETLREDLVSQRNALHESVESLKAQNATLGQDLETATKKLEIARNVIVVLKGDVASAREYEPPQRT